MTSLGIGGGVEVVVDRSGAVSPCIAWLIQSSEERALKSFEAPRWRIVGPVSSATQGLFLFGTPGK